LPQEIATGNWSLHCVQFEGRSTRSAAVSQTSRSGFALSETREAAEAAGSFNGCGWSQRHSRAPETKYSEGVSRCASSLGRPREPHARRVKIMRRQPSLKNISVVFLGFWTGAQLAPALLKWFQNPELTAG